MAIYDYSCPDCQSTFEANVKISEFDTAKIYCPSCKCKACNGLAVGSQITFCESNPRVNCYTCHGSGKVEAKRQISVLRATSTTWRNWRLDS